MATIPMQLAEALTGRYTLERELGRGGMAMVYLARDLRHDRHIALKVLRAELTSPISRGRFLREIRLTARLQHPHILPVYDSGEANELCWYTMPYVEGDSLRTWLRREGRLRVDEAVRIAEEVADALDYAHRHQVIHRDIKPENVLLSEGHALVADFGIAKAIGDAGADQLTDTGLTLGTPAYMSPEQVAGDRDIDARSDIYSLGCVLYEMLAGQPPFTSVTALAMAARHVAEQPPSARSVRPDVPVVVDRAILRAMGKKPEERFASTADFAVALTAEGALESLGSNAQRPSFPSFPTPLVGREDELAALKRLLRLRSLVTLVGPGGVGKSRLAIEFATQEGPNYRDGAYFVSLSAVVSPDLVPASIVEALGLTFATGESLLAQLQGYLRTKHLLLVLDNFEQLVESAPLLGHVLESASQVRFLVTSRERLDIAGEAVMEVRGLPVPASGPDGPPEGTGTDAVELFVERARHVDPAFTLSPEVQPAVVGICRVVEGLPLAIELAASMLRTLTAGELLEELDRSMDALATRHRDVPTRHRSLRAVFESSWAPLLEAERVALRRLAVFAEGFRSEAAEKVAGAPLQVLLALCDKFLVHRTASGRYVMHEAVRQYAAEKLGEVQNERAHCEDLRCQYYADFLRAKEERLKGRNQRVALDEIAEEIGNVRAGWHRAVELGNDYLISLYLWSLARFYDIRGWYEEGADMFSFAERSEHLTVVTARALSGCASFCFHLGWTERARALDRKSLAILRGLGAEREMISPLKSLGVLAASVGKRRASERLLRRAIRICRATGNRFELAGCLNALGITMRGLGATGEAEALSRESSAIRRQIGDYAGLGSTLNNLAVLLADEGRFEDARGVYQECLQIADRLGNPIIAANALINLSDLSLRAGRPEEARALAQQSLAQFRRMGVQEGIGACLLTLGEAAVAAGDRGQATEYLRDALEIAAETNVVYRIMTILISFAAIHAVSGERERARELLSLTIRHPATRKTDREKARQLLSQVEPSRVPTTLSEPRGRVDDELERAIHVLIGRQAGGVRPIGDAHTAPHR